MGLFKKCSELKDVKVEQWKLITFITLLDMCNLRVYTCVKVEKKQQQQKQWLASGKSKSISQSGKWVFQLNSTPARPVRFVAPFPI